MRHATPGCDDLYTPDRELNPPEELLPEADDPMVETNNDEERLFESILVFVRNVMGVI